MKNLALILFSLFMVFSACQETEPAPVAVDSVTLSVTSLELEEGETYELEATVSPSNAENKKVIWISSNGSVATVDEGVIDAHKEGKATITVKTDDGGKTAACEVTVTPKVIAVTSVSLDQTSVEMTEGDELQLTATVSPENATNKNVIWTSSDTSVVTVSDGKVTALKPGTTAIIVTSEDGGKIATCNIMVNEKIYPVTGISLDQETVEMIEGEELQLTATITPKNASNKNVIWSSSDSAIATVADGKVTAVKAGTVTVTATSEDGGKTASCNITISEKVYPVTGISLDKKTAEMVEGDELQLTATITPENASNKNIIWSSSDSAIATVADGKVTAVKAGTVTVTATSEDGGKTASCNITISEKVYPVTGISLDKKTAEMVEGDELQLTATITPENASNKNIIWSSSHNTIASVSDGKVTAKRAGTATITAKTEDGDKTATCKITVKSKTVSVTGVSLDRTTAELIEGESLTLTATVTPSNATNKKIIWRSSNASIATVSNGTVTAVKAGTATITATSEDGGKTATCNITVLSANVVTINLPPDNEIWYTSTTGEVIHLDYYPYELVSNTYENGIGKYRFKEDVVDIGAYFGSRKNDKQNLLKYTSLTLPSTIKKIDAYFAIGALCNASTLILPEYLQSIGVDFMGGFGENLNEKHVYFLSEECPTYSYSYYGAFWNQSSTLIVHYPEGSDYSIVQKELEKWKRESPNFEYQLVETSYKLVHHN